MTVTNSRLQPPPQQPPPWQQSKNDSNDNNDSNDDNDVVNMLQTRARRFEPMGRTHAQFHDMRNTEHLGWHMQRKRQRYGRYHHTKLVPDSYLPCRIASTMATRTFASSSLSSRTNCKGSKRKIVIEYLGVHLGYGTQFAEILETEFVPYNHCPAKSTIATGTTATLSTKHTTPNKNTSSTLNTHENTANDNLYQGWSPILLQEYQAHLWNRQRDKMIIRPAGFWNEAYEKQAAPHNDGDDDDDDDKRSAPTDVSWTDEAVAEHYWFAIEVHFLHNVLQQVQHQQIQQQQQKPEVYTVSACPQPDDESDGDHNNGSVDNDKIDEREDATPLPTNDADADNLNEKGTKTATVAVATTPYVKKLRAGDEISYCGMSVASVDNARSARIVLVHGRKHPATCLQLDNAEFVEATALIRLQRRYLRQSLIPVDRNEWAAVEDFTLDATNNGKVDFLMDQTRRSVAASDLFSQKMVQEAWKASSHSSVMCDGDDENDGNDNDEKGEAQKNAKNSKGDDTKEVVEKDAEGSGDDAKPAALAGALCSIPPYPVVSSTTSGCTLKTTKRIPRTSPRLRITRSQRDVTDPVATSESFVEIRHGDDTKPVATKPLVEQSLASCSLDSPLSMAATTTTSSTRHRPPQSAPRLRVKRNAVVVREPPTTSVKRPRRQQPNDENSDVHVPRRRSLRCSAEREDPERNTKEPAATTVRHPRRKTTNDENHDLQRSRRRSLRCQKRSIE